MSYIYTCLLDANKDEYSENCEFGLNVLEQGKHINKQYNTILNRGGSDLCFVRWKTCAS